MQVTPISQLFLLPHQTPIPLIAGVLTDIGPHKSGTNSYGQYSFQRAKLSDGASVIWVKFKDRPPVDPTLNGRKVYISSVNNNGVQAKDDVNQKTNQVQRVAWVTPNAIIDTQDGTGQAQQAQTPTAAQYQPPGLPYNQPGQAYQPPPHTQHTPQPPPQVSTPWVPKQNPVPAHAAQIPDLGPKSITARIGSVYYWSIACAVEAIAKNKESEEPRNITGEDVLKVATTIFIEAMRRVDLKEVPSLFDKPKQAAPPPPPPAPEPPPTPVIPPETAQNENDNIPF